MDASCWREGQLAENPMELIASPSRTAATVPAAFLAGPESGGVSGDAARVLLVARDPLVRAELAARLASQPDCVVVDEVPERGLLGQLSGAQVDVVVADLGEEDEAVTEIARLEELGLPVVVLLSGRRAPSRALSAGAWAWLSRDADARRLGAAIVAVLRGLTVLDPELTAGPMADGDPEMALEELTSRELQVLQLLAQGLPNRAIAQDLRISEHTVKFHISAIFGKLDAHSRTEAVAKAARLGLIAL